jgi:hypothetical protein
MLGLPNPNTELRTYRLHRKPLPNVKVANTADDNTLALNYVAVKRPRKALGITTGTADYATDPVLQQSLLAACRKANYPLLKGAGGETTARVPVYILSMDLADTFESQRNVHNGAGYVCQCGVWRLKTDDEAKRDKLPWNEERIAEYMDDESYHIGDATRQGWQTGGQGKDARTTRVGPRQIVECNPLTCPHINKTGKEKCKLGVTIYLKARDWGNDTPFRVECVSWETNARFPASWDLVRVAAQGLLLGCPLDLVLDWSKPKGTPDGTTRPRPFWTLALPWGMTEEQMRRVALDRARGIIADKSEALDLERQLQELCASARLPVSERSRLQEHEELPALPAASDVAPLSLSERDLAARLVNEWDMDATQAAAMVRANAGDLEGMVERMGPPPEAAEEDAQPPAVAGVLEPEDEAPSAAHEDAAEGEFETDPLADEEDESHDRYAESTAPRTDETESGAPEEGVTGPQGAVQREDPTGPVEPQPTLLDAPPSPMFPVPPENCYQIEDRFSALLEQDAFLDLVRRAWKQVAKTEKQLVPSPGTCDGDVALLANLTKNLLARAEKWWDTAGREKHGS